MNGFLDNLSHFKITIINIISSVKFKEIDVISNRLRFP